jgi:hypothetical protein
VKVVKEGKGGMGASLMRVEKAHILKTEEARVEGGQEDDRMMWKLSTKEGRGERWYNLFIINPIYFCLKTTINKKLVLTKNEVMR